MKKILLILFSLLFQSLTYSQTPPAAIGGELDLSNWKFENYGSVDLDGDWEFYWNELYSPQDFALRKTKSPELYHVPSLWNNRVIDGEKVSGEGYATFRLIIHLDGQKNLLALKTPRLETAHKIWINGKLLAENGIVAKSGDEMKARWYPDDLFFITENSQIELIIQISNFKHRKGGISQSLTIGTAKTIANTTRQEDGFTIFIIGVLLIMTIYHFGLFALRQKDKSTLFFGLTTLLTAMNSLTTGGILLVKFFPDFPWEWVVKLNFMTNYLRLGTFALFLAYLFAKNFNQRFVKIIAWFGIGMSAFVLVTPAIIYSHTLILFEIAALITLVYLMYGLVVASKKGQNSAIYSILGTIVLVLTVINDILHDNQIIQTTYLVSFGMFVFIFFQSFMLSLVSSNTFSSVERLSKRLLALDKIKNEFLRAQNSKLSEALRIILDNLATERGALILKQPDGWGIKVLVDINEPKNNIESFVLLHELHEQETPSVPRQLIQQVSTVQENITLTDAFKSEFKDDRYIKKTKAKSIVCYTLKENDELKGILYLEQKSEPNYFNSEKLSIIDMISSQLYTIIENSLIYEELELFNHRLEQKVKERTAEVYQQKEEILSQSEQLELKNQELEKLSIVASETDNAVAILTENGHTEWVNEGYHRMYGLKINDLNGTASEQEKKAVETVVETKKSFIYESLRKHQNGGKVWVQTTLSPMLNIKREVHKLISIDTDISKLKIAESEILQQKEEILSQRDEIESKNEILSKALTEISVKNQEITDSIQYAKRIQESILPSQEFINDLFTQSFILFKPKNVLSGDFFWFEKSLAQYAAGGLKQEKYFVAAVDCTGHGVPGALMSIIGNNLLNHAVNELRIFEPAKILDNMKISIRAKLNQKDRFAASQDGMDLALLAYDPRSKTIEFAGAKNPLFLIRNGELTVYNGDKYTIGGINHFKKKEAENYTQHSFTVEEDDLIYLFSDGYIDQFGGEFDRKFMRKNFAKLLIEIANKPIDKQKEILDSTIENWRGDRKQIDDILVIGLQF